MSKLITEEEVNTDKLEKSNKLEKEKVLRSSQCQSALRPSTDELDVMGNQESPFAIPVRWPLEDGYQTR